MQECAVSLVSNCVKQLTTVYNCSSAANITLNFIYLSILSIYVITINIFLYIFHESLDL